MTAIEIEREEPQATCIKVIGIGGGGCNTVSDMFNMAIDSVEFYALNTDIQSLRICQCPNKIQIGKELTNGLGAGSNPEIGEQAALAAKDEIAEILKGADMVFITAGFGGGTGTGAAPVVVEIAKEMGILTVAVLTRPFQFEGPQRIRRAEEGIEKLRGICDTIIAISNERLLEVVGSKASLLEAFHIANNVLAQGVQSISELITHPGLINVDFADIKTIMGTGGGAVMGVGVGKGENRAIEAVKKACSNQLLDKIVIEGAKGILICVNGPADLTLQEINEATTMVYEAAEDDANIIFGAVINENAKDEVKVTIIATGFTEDNRMQTNAKKAHTIIRESVGSKQPIRELTVNREETGSTRADSKGKRQSLNLNSTRVEIEPDIFKEEESGKADSGGMDTESEQLEEEKEVTAEKGKNVRSSDEEEEEKKQGDEYDIPAIFRRRRLIF